MASSFNGDCFGDMGFHELAMSLLDRPRTFFRTNNGGYASETTTETKKEAMNPLPSSVVSSSTSGTESFLEIAVYMHSFHNLDLFQQGWYQVKVTTHWETSHDVQGVPSRVIQYEVSDLTDETTTNWQISDADNSFSTRPFHIKYARQDVALAVMVSFNLSIKDIEWLLCDAVMISFQLCHAPAETAVSSSNIFSEYSLCASHDFRILPKSLIGLHAYCPVYFDAWHRVLLDACVHSVMLKPNSSLLLQKNQKSGQYSTGEDIACRDVKILKNGYGINHDDKEIALWKALCSSFNILMHELKLMGLAVEQCTDVRVEENASVALVLKNLACNMEDNWIIGDRKMHPNKQTWIQDVCDSLKLNEKLEGMQRHDLLPSRLELLEAFQALCTNILVLWNTFLKFHRLNRSLVWEYLRGIWADERCTESSLWLIHSKMDVPSITSIKKHLEGKSHNMQLLSKPVAQKPIEETYKVSASRAELHRKTLEQMKMTYPALQDMQIYHMPVQLPILYVESHIIPSVRIVTDCNQDTQKQECLPRTISNGKGKNLSVVVFVHGFQGHHLDLRLVRSQWLLIDKNAECLMSEINEDKTLSNFRDLGHRLAEEVAAFMKKKLTSMLKKSTLCNCKLSFVGHSMGNIIIRESLSDPVMKPFHEYLYTFLSVSGPHLGFMYNSNTLFNSGMWLLKKLKASPCMHQLSFTDESSIEECYLFKLSEKKTFEYFQNVLLLSSPQDRYVPYHSARVEICQAAAQDSRRGSAFLTMHRNCMQQILKSSSVKRNFIKCDVNFNTSTQTISFNSIIGRTAHIEFLETDIYLRFLMQTFPELFT